MDPSIVVGGALSVFVLAYLFFALLYPEKLS